VEEDDDEDECTVSCDGDASTAASAIVCGIESSSFYVFFDVIIGGDAGEGGRIGGGGLNIGCDEVVCNVCCCYRQKDHKKQQEHKTVIQDKRSTTKELDEKIDILQKKINHLNALSLTPGLTEEEAKAREEERDRQGFYNYRVEALAKPPDPRLPDISGIPRHLKLQWRNAEIGRPVAKWVEEVAEKEKIAAHETTKQQKKEREARRTRFHQGLKSMELQRRRSPGYWTSRNYWHTYYSFPGLPKRFQQYTTGSLMRACGVRNNWISRAYKEHGPAELAAIHCSFKCLGMPLISGSLGSGGFAKASTL